MKKCSDFPPSFRMVRLQTTDSTNAYLQRMPAETRSAAEFCVVTAHYQEAGRGQRGNSWESAPGANLLFSIGLRPHFLKAASQFALSRITSLAVRDTLAEFVSGVTIKWPNDIYAGHRKICGMLIECTLAGPAIESACIGVGINLNQQVFHSPAPNPVSLWQLTGRPADPDEVLARVLRRFETYYRQLEEGLTTALCERYLHTLYRRSGLHDYRDAEGPFRATLCGVEDDGHLLLCDESGRLRRYAFKEVSFVLPTLPPLS